MHDVQFLLVRSELLYRHFSSLPIVTKEKWTKHTSAAHEKLVRQVTKKKKRKWIQTECVYRYIHVCMSVCVCIFNCGYASSVLVLWLYEAFLCTYTHAFVYAIRRRCCIKHCFYSIFLFLISFVSFFSLSISFFLLLAAVVRRYIL